jgi:hypothetical protein
MVSDGYLARAVEMVYTMESANNVRIHGKDGGKEAGYESLHRIKGLGRISKRKVKDEIAIGILAVDDTVSNPLDTGYRMLGDDIEHGEWGWRAKYSLCAIPYGIFGGA